MAQTLPDIVLNKTWQSINTLSGIAVGTSMIIQTKGAFHKVILAEGTQPTSDSRDGRMIDRKQRDASVIDGSDEIWGRTVSGTCRVFIEGS